MIENNLARPAISVDLKKYRIRIHKNTLHFMGDPDYVLLLVNPEERTLAILQSNRSEPRAHHIKAASISNKPFELYSRSLVKSLRDVCSTWQDNQSYRMYGEIISNEGVAQFRMDESVLVNWAKS
ncbi:MAG: hypothetical protein GX115_15785 [Ruminiclostridium sp.]|nr:hypothetical protein [Ruminiclostridium sp.]